MSKDKADECVKVVLRCRPMNSTEKQAGRERIVEMNTSSGQIRLQNREREIYDAVIAFISRQKMVRSTVLLAEKKKVKLKLITAPKGLFGRRTPGAAARIDGEMLAGALQQGLNAIEERALWSRYGL